MNSFATGSLTEIEWEWSGKKPGTSFANISANSAPVSHSKNTLASSGFLAFEFRPIPISVWSSMKQLDCPSLVDGANSLH